VPSAIANGNANLDPSANAHFNTEFYTVGDADANANADGDTDTDSDSYTSGDTGEYSNPAASRVKSDSGII
jgi:hypothetical protein